MSFNPITSHSSGTAKENSPGDSGHPPPSMSHIQHTHSGNPAAYSRSILGHFIFSFVNYSSAPNCSVSNNIDACWITTLTHLPLPLTHGLACSSGFWMSWHSQVTLIKPSVFISWYAWHHERVWQFINPNSSRMKPGAPNITCVGRLGQTYRFYS